VSFLSIGDRIGDRYVIQAEVGRGGMQEVYAAVDDTLQRRVALKVPQDARVARRFRESSVISARVNHPNVAKTLDYFEEDGRFYMVEEIVDGLNLRQVASQFTRLDPHAVAYMLHHLARGVAASHRAGVVHRDLKPTNILIGDGLALRSLKITDFGIAKMAAGEIDDAVAGGDETTRSSKTAMGALAYMAPEVIESPRTASMPADVWAVAAIAWELLTGEPPFRSGLQAVATILSGKRPALPRRVSSHVQFGGLSEQIHELIMQCFERDPNNRPTAARLAELCDDICYLTPARETGAVVNYPVRSFGFILSDAGETVFFHTQNVIGDGRRPAVGTRVWYTKFDGQPRPRAIPVLPILANE